MWVDSGQAFSSIGPEIVVPKDRELAKFERIRDFAAAFGDA
jgi:hypothetical protein